MSIPNQFDSYRPPGSERRPRRKSDPRREGGAHHAATTRRKVGAGAQDGSREQRMAEDFQFSSYYGKPVVKAPPWEWPIGFYLVLGGIAGGSAMLSTGAQVTGNTMLRRTTSMTAFGAAAAGSLCLVADLGRPERLLNMFRVFKLSSPMNIGSWILAGFSSAAALPAIASANELIGEKLPFSGAISAAAKPASVVAGALGGPLAGYTAVLLGNTSNPLWNDAKGELAYVFVSSASVASAGLAMVTTPFKYAGPARALAVTGAVADLAATRVMEQRLEPETEHHLPKLMKASEILVAAGGVGTAVAAATKSRALSIVSGLALAAGSACTRFGILNGGLASAQDPKATIEPQKRRVAAKLAESGTAETITT